MTRTLKILLAGVLSIIGILGGLGCDRTLDLSGDNTIIVEGDTHYESKTLEGVHVGIVDEDFGLIDETTSDSSGYFMLEVDGAGSYTILASYEGIHGQLMAVKTVGLFDEENLIDLNLETPPAEKR